MTERQQLLVDLNPLLREMEDDLRARCDEVAQINTDLTHEYEQAGAANRLGITFEEWRGMPIEILEILRTVSKWAFSTSSGKSLV